MTWRSSLRKVRAVELCHLLELELKEHDLACGLAGAGGVVGAVGAVGLWQVEALEGGLECPRVLLVEGVLVVLDAFGVR